MMCLGHVAVRMAREASTTTRVKCVSCGFEAPQTSEEWERVDYPPLGTLTKCPNCGSTNTHNVG